MSLFTYFEKFNIQPDEIESLTDKDIIRIEKKLKAEARLNADFDHNEIENVLEVLKNHKDQLALIFNGELELLRAILTNPHKFLFTNNQILVPEGIDNEKMSAFLDEYFGSVLLIYVESCIKKEYYNALHSLLKHKAILSFTLLDEVQKKLDTKINYAIECIRIKTHAREEKIGFVTNPFFFRCMSEVGASHFDSQIRSLLNTSIDKYGESDFNLMLFFAMNSYSSQNERLKETLQSNADFARRRGVIEVVENPFTHKKTGGTKITTVASTPVVNRSKITNKQEERKDSRGCLIFFGIIIGIIAIVQVIRTNEYDTNDDLYWDSWEIEVPDDEVDDGTPRPDRETISTWELEVYKPEEPSLEDVINYLNEPGTEILSQTDIPFEIEKTGLNKFDELQGGMESVNVINRTGRRVLIMIKTAYWEQYEFLEPDSSFMTKSIASGFKVYMGDEPQMVDYLDENGEQCTHFWFKDSGPKELEQLNEYWSVAHEFPYRRYYDLEITWDNEEIDFEVNETVFETPVEEVMELLLEELETRSEYPFPDYSNEGTSFEEIMDYLNNPRAPIIDSRRISFSAQEAKLNQDDPFAYTDQNVLIENGTKRTLLIMVETPSGDREFALLGSYNKFNTSPEVSKYHIFFGDEPMIVTYLDENRDTMSHFRFGRFEEADWDNFSEPHTFGQKFKPNTQYIIQITYEAWSGEFNDVIVEM